MAVRIEINAEPIPGYRLIERIGGGGFGEVWKCEAPGGLHKAIKFVFGSLELAGDGGQRAEQELKALSRVKTVRHPYILSLERYDIVDGQLFIVMELADKNLWDRFKECRAVGHRGIPREELLRYMEESAEALDLMNSEFQLQHLDIKPQNIFLVHNHIKVADFGLVKDLEGSQASITGGITPVYAAPETFDGKVSRFSDQYSLAIVFQELLTGQRPFSGSNVRQLIMQHLASPPNLEPLPPSDQPIIGKALSKDPNDRYPTCRDMVDSLRHSTMAKPGVVSSPELHLPDRDSSRPVVASSHTEEYTTPPGAVTPEDALTVREGHSRTPSSPSPPLPPGPAKSPPRSAPLDDRPARDGPITHNWRRAPQESATPSKSASVPVPPDGDGILRPTLVIGLGGLGAAVLQAFRAGLADQFGSLDQVGNLRTLLLDTDPDVLKLMGKDLESPSGITATELLLTPLNRPTHYLKPREGRGPIDTWLTQRMLYRIPREQMTSGVRALGRLAFFDHYRLVQRRLLQELEACKDSHHLRQAGSQTGLGVWTTRPRVYIVASTMGGTGSGMFLDVAYTVRALLRRLGFEQPEVCGLLLVPYLDSGVSRQGTLTNPTAPISPGVALAAAARLVPIGNTCAALTELRYYSHPRTEFTARYLEHDTGLADQDAPFSQTMLLPIPEELHARASRETIGMAARYLLADSCTHLGRVVESKRPGSVGLPVDPTITLCHTFGLYRVSFPRRQVLQRLGRRCLFALINRWMSKDASSLEAPLKEWVASQWAEKELGLEPFVNRVQEGLQKRLTQSPESEIAACLELLNRQVQERGDASSVKRSGLFSRSRPTPLPLPFSPEDVAEVLERLEAVFGRPEAPEETGGLAAGSAPTGKIGQSLKEVCAGLAAEWSQKLAEWPVRLIEQPAYRLAGAEECIRQTVALLEKILRTHEPLARDLDDKATQEFTRLMAFLISGTDPRRAAQHGAPQTPLEVMETLHHYTKVRFQALLLHAVLSIYISLRGHLTDTLREINFCRARLGELTREFEDVPPPQPLPGRKPLAPPSSYNPALEGMGRYLFPMECKDLEQAVQAAFASISPADLTQLDDRLQLIIRKQFVALIHICLASTNVTRNVVPVFREVAELFLVERLPHSNVARLFLDRAANLGSEDALTNEIVSLYEETMPEPSRTPEARGHHEHTELVVLSVPPGPDGERLCEETHRVLSDVQLSTLTTGEDLLFYREWTNLPITELQLFSGIGQQAYEQMLSAEAFTPHIRQDITFEPPS